MKFNIKITEENKEEFVSIVNRNKMNPYKYKFARVGLYYIIENGIIQDWSFKEYNDSLDIIQFKKLFDKITELDVWLEDTKAKNLSYDELIEYIGSSKTCPFVEVYNKLEGDDYEKAKILFNKLNPKFNPKQGDKVLVWDDNENNSAERIFLCIINIDNLKEKILVVRGDAEFDYEDGKPYYTNQYKNMKPIVELDFKTKVIQLIEKEINYGTGNAQDILNKIRKLN